MKCRCEIKEKMTAVCKYGKDHFATIGTVDVFYCFGCGRLLLKEGSFEDWYEPKAVEKKRKAEERAAAKKAKEVQERKEYERLKEKYG